MDISNQKFNRLTAIKIVGKNNNGYIWMFECDCGNFVNFNGSRVKNGYIKSCGCLNKENIIKNGRNRKEYGQSMFNSLYCNYKNIAKKRGLLFELTKEQFGIITKQNCFYCNKEPIQTMNNTRKFGYYFYNGIDRIDSSKGYIIDNVVPCCKICNTGKTDLSKDEFLSWIKSVYIYSINKQ